jgi:transposase-like protein
MDPQTVFCPNLDCPARGQVGQGNIGIHQVKERRYICHTCKKTFSATKGTPLYRLRTDPAQVTLVLALLAYGCPVCAIVFAFGLDERTVRDWEQRAGHHSEQVHEHLIQQPRDLGQVQADEIRVKMQKRVVWLALAVQVSTRLWLGAAVSEHRDETLVTELMQRVRACALCRRVSSLSRCDSRSFSRTDSDALAGTPPVATLGWYSHCPSGEAICPGTCDRGRAPHRSRNRIPGQPFGANQPRRWSNQHGVY